MSNFGPQLEILQAVAGSLSGKLLAIGGRRDCEIQESRVHVFVAARGETKASITVDGPVGALEFLLDDLLVVGSGNKLIGGDVGGETPKRAFAVSLGAGKVTALARDRMGRRLAIGSDDGKLRVCRLEVGGAQATLQLIGERTLSSRALRALAIDDATETLAAAGDDGVIRSVPIDRAASAPLREMPCGEGGVWSLAFTGDGRVIAGCGDGSIRVCFLEGAIDEEDRSGDSAHRGPVRALIRGPERLFSVSEDGELKSWIFDTKRKPKTVSLGSPRLLAATSVSDKLAIVDAARRLTLVAIEERSDVGDSIVHIGSAFERLAADLEAKSVQVRLDAVDALEKLPEDDARALLDRALGDDSSADVRKRAAEAIGRTDRRLSRPALRAALDHDRKEVREAALDALRAIERDAPLAPARAALSSKHADVRATGVKRLPALRAHSPLVPGLIAGKLSDPDADVRTAALDALAELEPGNWARTAIDRGPADVRNTALLRLAFQQRARDPEGHALVEAALDDPDPSVRAVAFHIAVGARPRLAARLVAVDPAMAKALSEQSKQGRFSSESTDGELVESDRQPLFAALACRHPDTALRGARALAVLGDVRAVGALLQLSREADPNVRRFSVEALLAASASMPEDQRISSRLEWLLDDADDNVRGRSFEGLAALAEMESPALLLDHAELALRTSRDDIRFRALQVLVKFAGNERADRLLGDALDDEAAKVRGEAFRTLWAWHVDDPRSALERGVGSRHADVRKRVAQELVRIAEPWSEKLLLALIGDAASDVGLFALECFTKDKKNLARTDIFLAALSSTRPDVRAAGCRSCHRSEAAALRSRLLELIDEERPEVHHAAIEAADALMPNDSDAFRRAFSSIFYGLRVRAGELCGKRRDPRAIEPMKALLSIPKTQLDRPSDDLRQRAARALADVGDPSTIPFFIALLDDEDPIVREMGSRGLATACRPGAEKPLVDALSHADLAVRSWAAEGLARLGDVRALPVLSGTLDNDHRPLRAGSIMGLVALGPDGVRGVLKGLEDRDRLIQDFAFAIILARDLALAKKKLAPDLLLSALAASHPELRFAAARALEERSAGVFLGEVATELVGPRKLERASEMKDWPPEAERKRLLEVIVEALASEHPVQRYSAAQVLWLRHQPDGFWREAKQLARPGGASRPHTNWEDEGAQPRKRDWVRRLFGKIAGAQESEVDPGEIGELVFGTYAGLVRQAPPPKDADETHRVRRDALERLSLLAKQPAIGAEAVLPIFRRALSDPHHLVRKAAASALATIYPQGSLEPLALALDASADVGRAAVDELIEKAVAGDGGARELAKRALDASNAEVRAHALGRLPRLFDEGSLEPWLIALSAEYADVRLAVIDRLIDSKDERVTDAFERALESDHEDLRMKAAFSLARRGDARTVDVLAAFLRSEDRGHVRQATKALTELGQSKPDDAARAIAARLEDDPDQTADRGALISALATIGSPAGAPVLKTLLAHDDSGIRNSAFQALMAIATDRTRPALVLVDGTRRERYRDSLALDHLDAALHTADIALRTAATKLLAHVDDPGAEALLARALEDREESVRVSAAEVLAFRAEHIAEATLDPLAKVLRAGRRELVLPSARGLASRGRREAFQALMLVFKAGELAERQQAVLGLGTLGDDRAIEDLLVLVEPKSADVTEDDLALAPFAAEALGSMIPKISDGEKQLRVRELVERLAREGQATVRQRAVIGLRRAGDDRSRNAIERIASDRWEDASVRLEAVAQLGISAAESSVQPLAEVLNDGDRTLRQRALEALGRILPHDKTRVSLLALESRHWDISQPAAAFLAKRGDPETLVSRLAEISDRNVRKRLRQGLVRRRVCPIQVVTSLLASDRAAPRAEAAWIAGANGGAELAGAISGAVQRSAADWEHDRWNGRTDLPAREEAWLASLWAATRLHADVRNHALAAAQNEHVPAAIRQEALHFLETHGNASDVAFVRSLRRAPPRPATEELIAAAGASGREPARLRAIATLGTIGGDRPIEALAAIRESDRDDAVRAAAFKALRRAQRRAKHSSEDR